MNPEEVLQALVSTPSPTGEEAAAVRLMQDLARADGFRVRQDRAGNLLAEAGHGDRLLLFVGHIDTVPGDIPVRVEDGELWGRGAVDAKGPLAAFYSAAREFVKDPRIRILVVGAVDEEGRSAGVKALPPDLDPEWIIVGEPSSSHAITLGYKGILRAAYHLERPSIHGAHPEEGAADRVVSWWSSLCGDLGAGQGFQDVQLRLEAVQTQSDGLTERATGAFQVRIPPGAAPRDLEKTIRDHSQDRGVQVTFHERMHPIQASPRTALAAAFRTAIRAEGATPVAKNKTGTADMNHLGTWHEGVPILAYGPGDPAFDHRPDERIGLEEYGRGVRVLRRVIETLAASTP